MVECVEIEGKKIGRGNAPYFVAEIGNNHNGDLALAKKMIDAAVACGADAVKFQSWRSNTLMAQSLRRNKDSVLPWDELERYQLTFEMHYDLKAYCEQKSITFMSSAFRAEEIELLVKLKVPALKVSSGELINLPLLELVASTRLPVILATGMSYLGEIERAVETLTSHGASEIILLHCVSNYPAEAEAINLNYMQTLEKAFGFPVGFSDHSLGTAIPLAAVALGAVMIEKHFTTDKKLEGWDHAISADPEEMGAIVREGRIVYQALGSPCRKVSEREREMRKLLSRSIILKKALKSGSVLTQEDLDFKRPGLGIPPDQIKSVLGRRLVRDKADEDVLFLEDLA